VNITKTWLSWLFTLRRRKQGERQDAYVNSSDDFFAIEQRTQRLYDEGRRLFLQGKHEEALERFKRIYEDTTVFRDVAEIVEDYYAKGEDAWIAKYRPRFERQDGVV
jgi:hypothetical protein